MSICSSCIKDCKEHGIDECSDYDKKIKKMFIDPDECIACGQCVEVCKVYGIVIVKTHDYARFVINDNCISCGACKRNCLNEAIKET